ncbi:hypothetical protein [Fibrella arboris]|uniref:hypothetical protein n=1 Tax=Fibrella arboris TaxID=3242486 RepID=UPI003521251D
MNTRKSAKAAICGGCLLLLSLSGCVVRPVASRPAPPPARIEVIPAAPPGRYVWSPGYHRYRRSGYVWVPGRYRRIR